MQWWNVESLWYGEPCFLVGGGPSAANQSLELLEGRHVIAINSSWQKVPFSEILFFGDPRWWREYGREVLTGYSGIIATAEDIRATDGVRNPRIKHLRRCLPPGLQTESDSVTLRRTSMTAAINLAVHLGVTQIVLLGADGKSVDGRTHHHAPYHWDQRTDCWKEQREDLETLCAPLNDLGIRVINASPGSALADLWPVTSLTHAISLLKL